MAFYFGTQQGISLPFTTYRKYKAFLLISLLEIPISMDAEGIKYIANNPMFKYTSLETCHKILEYGKVKFTNPKDFNDPLDFDIRLLKFTSSHFSRNSKVKEAVNAKFPKLTRPEKRKVAKDILRRTNKGVDIDGFLSKSFSDLRNTSGVFCLSATNTNPQMWSYYADNHKGVCLEFGFNMAMLGRMGVMGFRVNYKKEFSILESQMSSDLFDEKVIEHYFATKECGWSHEQEYRLIKRDITSTGPLIQFDYTALKSIYVGMRVPPIEIERIKKSILAGRGKFLHADIYRMTVQPNSYTMAPQIILPGISGSQNTAGASRSKTASSS